MITCDTCYKTIKGEFCFEECETMTKLKEDFKKQCLEFNKLIKDMDLLDEEDKETSRVIKISVDEMEM